MQTEDRPVVKERVEYVEEHRPVEQEFVVSPPAWRGRCGAGGVGCGMVAMQVICRQSGSHNNAASRCLLQPDNSSCPSGAAHHMESLLHLRASV